MKMRWPKDFMNQIVVGDCIETMKKMPAGSVHCCVTSPPYWGLRDYGVDGQLGLEKTPEEFVEKMVGVLSEVWRVLRPDGTLWLNMGDCYATGAGAVGDHPGGGEQGKKWAGSETRGSRYQRLPNGHGKRTGRKAMGPMTQPNRMPIAGLKPKNLVGQPWRLAFALQGFAVVPFRSFSIWADELKIARESKDWEAVEIIEGKLRRMDSLLKLQSEGWYLRSDIIWAKTNPMPESIKDRPAKAHEYIFLLTKSDKYYYDAQAIKEPVSQRTIDRGPVDFGGEKGRAAAENIKPGDPRYRGGSSGTQWGKTFDYKKSCENGRNKRTVWTVSTQPYSEAHFATFPPKLIEPCILAGTSEKGACAECGAPQIRKTESFDTGLKHKMADGWEVDPGAHGTIHRKGRTKGESGKPVIANRTIGWEPSCKHRGKTNPAIVPCVVMDPFSGAGTTALVSAKYGRSFVGLELNAEYAEMSRRRIANEVAQGKLL